MRRPVCPRQIPSAARPASGLNRGGVAAGGAIAGCSGAKTMNAVPITSYDCGLSEWQIQLSSSSRSAPQAPPASLRPPWFVHVLLYASRVGNSLPFALPHGQAHAITDALLKPKRTQPMSLGWVRWSGTYGQLVLAPGYPRGGEAGDHLIFSFSAGGVSYAITLHSWAPLVQTVATLKSIVASAR